MFLAQNVARTFFASLAALLLAIAACLVLFSEEAEASTAAIGVEEPLPGLVRLAGNDRYGTMNAIVSEGFARDSCEWVVVASGENFPDALAASALAGALDAPMILTGPASLSAEAAYQIMFTGATKAIVVGGSGAVSNEVFAQIDVIVSKGAQRVWGDNRLATSTSIYREGLDLGIEWSDTAIVATAGGFADALSISPYAYATESPVFLADSVAGLPHEALAAIASGSFSRVVIVGGESAVPISVDASLLDLGVEIVRVAGDDRYETSEAIASWAEAQGVLDASYAGLATGLNFPDALAGGALCGSKGSALLLVESPTSPAMKWIETRSDQVIKAYVLGGTEAVPQRVEDTVAELIGWWTGPIL